MSKRNKTRSLTRHKIGFYQGLKVYSQGTELMPILLTFLFSTEKQAQPPTQDNGMKSFSQAMSNTQPHSSNTDITDNKTKTSTTLNKASGAQKYGQ